LYKVTMFLFMFYFFVTLSVIECWSQWPCGLRHKPSSSSWTLGSLVRIPLKAWVFVCVYSVCR
jgi:hypothetical protein